MAAQAAHVVDKVLPSVPLRQWGISFPHEMRLLLAKRSLVRYCLRGPLALERLSKLRDGSLAYRTKYGRGQRTHLVMTPVEFLARVASLVPPPRIPLVRYFGVLAPHSPYRDRVVPKTSTHDETQEPEKPKSKRANKDPNESLSLCSTVPDDDDESRSQTSRYIDWATLMKRTFGIDPLRCPKCEARMKVLAVISQPEVVDKILAHVGLPVEPDVLVDGCTLAFDVTGEPIPPWAVGTDPQGPESEPHGYERGPPCAFDGVDPPCPDDVFEE